MADPYFTVTELRTMFPALANATTYPDAKIDAAREYVERRIENICGVSFVPRTDERTINTSGEPALTLPAQLRTVTAVTVDGDAFTTADLDALNVTTTGVLYRGTRTGWTGLVTVTYTHGYDAPPVDVKDAAMLWTRERVLKGPVTDRATQIPTESGGSINLATPGLLGSHSGIPEVDSVLEDNRVRVFVA